MPEPDAPLRARIVSDPTQPKDRVRILGPDDELLTEIVIDAEDGSTDERAEDYETKVG